MKSASISRNFWLTITNPQTTEEATVEHYYIKTYRGYVISASAEGIYWSDRQCDTLEQAETEIDNAVGQDNIKRFFNHKQEQYPQI